MGGRTKKSKKRSAGSLEQSQLDAFVLFLDEGLHNCQPIHSAVSELHVAYKRHGDCFPGIADSEWLPEIGKQGWVLLTSDKRIRFNQLERDKISQFKIRQFVFSSGNLSGAMMGEILKLAIPKMRKLCAVYPAPFIACILQSGAVEVRYDKDGPIHGRPQKLSKRQQP